jgi:hypothetical protein
MKNILIALGVLVLSALLGTAESWSAPALSETEIAQRQALLLPKLQQAAAEVAGCKSGDIDVKTAGGQLTITVSNSALNNASVQDRLSEASSIVSELAEAIMGKAEFAKVTVMNVEYVKRPGFNEGATSRFVFYKNASGAFMLQRT